MRSSIPPGICRISRARAAATRPTDIRPRSSIRTASGGHSGGKIRDTYPSRGRRLKSTATIRTVAIIYAPHRRPPIMLRTPYSVSRSEEAHEAAPWARAASTIVLFVGARHCLALGRRNASPLRRK
jgi:hypothetical protein